MGEDEFKFQLVSPRVRQKHRNLAYEGKSTAGTSSSRKSWSGFRSNTPATADKITRQASNRENSDSWEVGACPLWDSYDVPVPFDISEQESSLALARGAVDIELFETCSAIRQRVNTDNQIGTTLQIALGAYDNACRKTLRSALHDWKGADNDTIGNSDEDHDFQFIRAQIKTLKLKHTLEKTKLKLLESEIKRWHGIRSDCNWLPKLKHDNKSISLHRTPVVYRRTGQDFLGVAATGARKAAGAFISATAAQRELYKTYDQARFGDVAG